MTKQITIKNKVLIAAIICLIAAIAILSGSYVHYTRAEDIDDLVAGYENTNVLDDLKGSTVGGEKFNLDDYPQDKNGKIQIISFNEFGYSFYSDEQDDYGLYVYVYNPQQRAVDVKSVCNFIQFSCGDSTTEHKCSLTYLNRSTGGAYDMLFYKFRIELTYSQRTSVLQALNRNERVYRITGIELSVNGVVKDNKIVSTYTYSGFAQGYGSQLTDSDTLSCSVDGFGNYINLNVKSTYYRSDGKFTDGEYTQLDSVYFRIPNEFLRDYGKLSAVDCEWYQYLTQPILVTTEKGAYSAVRGLSGSPLSDYKGFYYLFLMMGMRPRSVLWFDIAPAYYMSNYAEVDYDGDRNWGDGGDSFYIWRSNYSRFAAAFSTDINPLDYTVDGDDLKLQLLENSKNVGGYMYRDRYSSELFANESLFQISLADTAVPQVMDYNHKTITPDDKFPVIWKRPIPHWYWGITDQGDVKSECRELEAFHDITETDLQGDDKQISNTLFVSERDVADIKAEFALAKAKDETLVLFRFNSTKYFAYPTAVYGCDTNDSDVSETLVDGAVDILDDYADDDCECNAYIVREVVYLDFDIISLAFTKDGVSTVIPVVCTPIDIIDDVTPPTDLERYGSSTLWTVIKIVLIVIVALLIVWLLSKFGLLKPIGNGIVFIVTAPFKAISGVRKRRRDKKDNTSAHVQSPPNVNVTIRLDDKQKDGRDYER